MASAFPFPFLPQNEDSHHSFCPASRGGEGQGLKKKNQTNISRFFFFCFLALPFLPFLSFRVKKLTEKAKLMKADLLFSMRFFFFFFIFFYFFFFVSEFLKHQTSTSAFVFVFVFAFAFASILSRYIFISSPPPSSHLITRKINYQDLMSVNQIFGAPKWFLTAACNPAHNSVQY